jgi:hypothetical protein
VTQSGSAVRWWTANNDQSNESGGAASEKAKEAEGQIILCNPKKTESEPIAGAARANAKSREVAVANKYSRPAAARPTNEETAETLVSDEAWSRCRCCGSRLDRAEATREAVGGLSRSREARSARCEASFRTLLSVLNRSRLGPSLSMGSRGRGTAGTTGRSGEPMPIGQKGVPRSILHRGAAIGPIRQVAEVDRRRPKDARSALAASLALYGFMVRE